MAESPNVSVIIPAHDVADYLEACVKSVLAQPVEGIEVFIVDDGSQDATADVAEALAAQDARVSLVHQAQAGAGPARMAGVTASSGTWVLFLDADDVLSTNALEALINKAEGERAEQVFFDLEPFCDDAAFERRLEAARERMARVGTYPRTMVGTEAFGELADNDDLGTSVTNQLLRRDLLLRAELSPTGRAGEDAVAVAKLTLASARTAHLGQAAVRKRIRPGSRSSSRRTLEDAQGVAQSMRQICELVQSRELDTPELRHALLRHLRSLAGIGATEVLDSYGASVEPPQIDEDVLNLCTTLPLDDALWLYLAVCQRAEQHKEARGVVEALEDARGRSRERDERLEEMTNEVDRLRLLVEYGWNDEQAAEAVRPRLEPYVAPWRKLPTAYIVPAAEVKVSVVLPIASDEAHLRQCLDSIISQTLSDIEVVCVDMGGEDRSLQIAMDYADHDARIRVVSHPGVTLGEAKNLGLAAVRGQYVFFCRADAFLDSTALEHLWQRAEDLRCDICVCGARQMAQAQTYPAPWHMDASRLPVHQTFNRSTNADHILTFTSAEAFNKLFLRDFIARLGLAFEERDAGCDTRFVCAALCVTRRVCATSEELVTYHADVQAGSPDTRALDVVQALASTGALLVEKDVLPRKSFSNRAAADASRALMAADGEAFRRAADELRVQATRTLCLDEHPTSWYFEPWHADFVHHLQTDRTPELKAWLADVTYRQMEEGQAEALRRAEQIRRLNTQVKRSRSQLETTRDEVRRLAEQNKRLARHSQDMELKVRELEASLASLEEAQAEAASRRGLLGRGRK